jgi:hypothetical protein
MGRNVDADSTPLLRNAEQNIGNSVTLIPEVGTSGTVIPQNSPQRLIALSGGSAAGQTTSIILTAARIAGPENPKPGFAGPVTAIIEFGNGGRNTRAEIDVPYGPYQGFVNATLSNNEPQDGGVIVSVPTGVLRVYTRYDNLLIQPLINRTNVPPPAFVPISFAQDQGLAVAGPGAGFPGPNPPGKPPFPAEPMLVKAMTAYFSRHFARAYKTQYCFISPDNNPYLVGHLNIGGTISPYSYVVPAFARSLRVQRSPITASLIVVLSDVWGHITDQITIPSGSPPTIPIVGQTVSASLVSATNTNADKVDFLALCYEIGI